MRLSDLSARMHRTSRLRSAVVVLMSMIFYFLNYGQAAPTPAPSSPGPVSLISPKDGATRVPVTSALNWHAAKGATSYDVWLYRHNGFSCTTLLLHPEATVTSTTYSPGILAAWTKYCWRVVAHDDSGGTSLDTGEFTTGPGVNPGLHTIDYGIPTPNSGPVGVVSEFWHDKVLWFTESLSSKIGRVLSPEFRHNPWIDFGFGALSSDPTILGMPTIFAHSTTSFEVAEFSTPTPNSGPYAIATETNRGIPNNKWFTEVLANKIGRITPDGVITEYPIPTPMSGPTGIVWEDTSDPAGAAWFTEILGHKIGRITAAGVITEYATPTSGSGPYAITRATDGTMWFTESSANKIGRITISGVITEYSIPTPNSVPQGIALGPDGTIWFTESLGNKIGRITTDGDITEYPLPTSGARPQGITKGPDYVAMWFTEASSNKIGRIDSDGVITEYPAPTRGGGPFGITLGPNEDPFCDCANTELWFVEYSGNKIGIAWPL